MFIGLTLAAATTTASGRTNYSTTGATGALALVTPLIVVAAVVFVPLLDLLLAVVRRTRAGRSPFAPDKMHLHHRLLEIGNSHTKAVLLMWFWAALLGFGGVAASFSSGPVMVLAIVAGLALLSLLTLRSPRPRSPL